MKKKVDCWLFTYRAQFQNGNVTDQEVFIVPCETGLKDAVDIVEAHCKSEIPEIKEVQVLEIKRMVPVLMSEQQRLSLVGETADGKE